MNRVFASLPSFSRYLEVHAATVPEKVSAAVGAIAGAVFVENYASIGNASILQPDLAPSTLTARKHGWGYYRNAPASDASVTSTLLWSGALRSSYEMMHEGPIAGVGSPNPVAQWQEIGTPRIPPRYPLRRAAERAAPESWIITRYYAAQMIGVNAVDAPPTYLPMPGVNIANLYTGALSRAKSKYL